MTRPTDPKLRSITLVATSLLGLALVTAPVEARFRREEPAGKTLAAPVAAWPSRPHGTIILAVSLADQRLTIWDDGVVVARSAVSTGVAGRETPRGVFTLLQKQRMHRSNIYSNAPMPFMQRITWSGVALHEGHVTGRPASHGCIRLPADVARKLFTYTRIGARVIVTDDPVTPADFVHPALFSALPPAPPQPEPAAPPVLQAALAPVIVETAAAVVPAAGPLVGEAVHIETAAADTPPLVRAPETQPAAPVPPVEAASPPAPQPEAHPSPMAQAAKPQPTGHVSIFISGKERKLFIRQGFEPVYESPVEIAPGAVLGAHLFTAMEVNQKDGSVHWSRVSLPVKGPRNPGAAEALEQIQIPEQARLEVGRRLAAGASLLISDQGLGRETGKTATDFVLLTP